jgi:hypothetical protein
MAGRILIEAPTKTQLYRRENKRGLCEIFSPYIVDLDKTHGDNYKGQKTFMKG